MDSGLEAIRKAWNPGDPEHKATGKRDEDKARSLADAYVADNADSYAGYEHISEDIVVRMLEEARERGDEDEEWRLQVWLFHRFNPKQVGVLRLDATVRRVNG